MYCRGLQLTVEIFVFCIRGIHMNFGIGIKVYSSLATYPSGCQAREEQRVSSLKMDHDIWTGNMLSFPVIDTCDV
jgi:hypothetical protein